MDIEVAKAIEIRAKGSIEMAMEGDIYAQFATLNISDPGNNMQDINEESQQDEFQDLQGNCNLIVNYLPHDIDDLSLRVYNFFLPSFSCI